MRLEMTSAGKYIQYQVSIRARLTWSRYLNAARSIWIGVPTIIKLYTPTSANHLLIPEFEHPDMIVSSLDANCGFSLTDPADPRYQKVHAYRQQFGQVLGKASSILRQNDGGEDHVDAVIWVTRCIDTYMTSYGITSSEFESLQKNFRQARESVDFECFAPWRHANGSFLG